MKTWHVVVIVLVVLSCLACWLTSIVRGSQAAWKRRPLIQNAAQDIIGFCAQERTEFMNFPRGHSYPIYTLPFTISVILETDRTNVCIYYSPTVDESVVEEAALLADFLRMGTELYVSYGPERERVAVGSVA